MNEKWRNNSVDYWPSLVAVDVSITVVFEHADVIASRPACILTSPEPSGPALFLIREAYV